MKAGITDEACARELLDTLPMGVRVIRRHMRRHRSGLTVPQFRTLCFPDHRARQLVVGRGGFRGAVFAGHEPAR